MIAVNVVPIFQNFRSVVLKNMAAFDYVFAINQSKTLELV